MRGVDISLAGGWIEVACIVHPPGEVVISMRPVSVFAKGPAGEIEKLEAGLHGRWRQATRAVMVLLSLHGLAPSQIAELLDCHPATVRRWIGRFNDEGMAGLADRARCGRPRLGGRRLAGRIAALLGVAAGQPSDAVPAGPAGGDLAAAQAGRPRRPGP